MKSNSLRVIEKLVSCLDEKDQKIAERFLEKRDFESLSLLVKSALKQQEKRQDDPERLEEMTQLYGEICVYKEMLDNIFGVDTLDSYETFPEYENPDDFSEEDIW